MLKSYVNVYLGKGGPPVTLFSRTICVSFFSRFEPLKSKFITICHLFLAYYTKFAYFWYTQKRANLFLFYIFSVVLSVYYIEINNNHMWYCHLHEK